MQEPKYACFTCNAVLFQEVFIARQMENSTMVGTGISPEGINQNYAIYDLMLEMGWRKEPTNLTQWFSEYATRRYGAYSLEASTAWDILRVPTFRDILRLDNFHLELTKTF